MSVTLAPLTAALRAEVLALETDLRARVHDQPTVADVWQALHREALDAGRTAASFPEWRDERVTQAAVGWVLVTVFVRYCEDNGLVDPVWIGPPQRYAEALDAQTAFFRSFPEGTDRDWIEQAVAHLAGLPATAGLVDEHSAIHLVTPSGDGAARLLAFWRQRGDDGRLVRDLTDPTWDTRFLGDLYQHLSEAAQQRYALLQTPHFVERLILDRTLEPALRDRGLDGFTMIDPTCGSGHFLLGAFDRILDRWHRAAPALDRRERVQRALDAVHGVDLNPYAVAIARFRLTLAALRASGLTRLADAPAFRYHLAVGDSLLHGEDQVALDFGVDFDEDLVLSGFAYSTEDVRALRSILTRGRYTAVVGNPPYITVKDKALNEAYRERYSACKGKYALTVPFMQRMFDLAEPGGWVGQITSNSFMKREFGTKLIEDFLPRVDLLEVVDTSGAYIPGHGTPTVIVVGRRRPPVGPTVRAVLGVRGEPGQPDDPAKGLVWSAIVDHLDEPGYDGTYVTVTDLPRERLATHPWSLTGGGAQELMQVVDGAATQELGGLAFRVGVFGIMGSDDAMITPGECVRRLGLESDAFRSLTVGEEIRDYNVASGARAWFPYDERHKLKNLETYPGAARRLWGTRTELGNRATFTKGTYFSDGRPWFEWHQLPKDVGATPLSIAFAFVATHNHFVLDRGGKVFKQSAPVIKLPEGAGEDEHLRLLGVLNSSIACFWLKQHSHNKGRPGAEQAGADEPWEQRYEFTGTTLQDFPLPAHLPLERARRLDALARDLAAHTPAAVCAQGVPSRAALDEARVAYRRIRAAMIAEQEELDWETYRLYGVLDVDLTSAGADLPGLALGERAFEIALARRMAAGEEETQWFARHGSTPITEVPGGWPEAYAAVVRQRLHVIATRGDIALLERPEHKRRWAAEPWAKQEQAALRGWLLDRLEDRRCWYDRAGRPQARSVGSLADDVGRDADLRQVLALWEGRPDVPVVDSLQRLCDGEAVPFLAAYRYKESGLRKRAVWEDVWARQRREDAGTYDPRPVAQGGEGPVPVPPKYGSTDFARPAYWGHRGKLDVPKERFVLYPAAGRATDPTPVLGWAGWDHAEQALALARLVQEREAEGWDDERLVPLLAGLAELQPWLEQWHSQPDPLYGAAGPAGYFGTFLEGRARAAGRSMEQLRAWRPAPAARGRRRKG